MPRIFRVMRPLDGKPETGSDSCMLGVRESDLGREAADDLVDPAKSGMSVGGCVRTTYLNILPQRLAKIYPQWARGAKGRNANQVWAMGQGKYEAAPVSADLNLHFQTEDRPGHGLVAPSRKMLLEEYQAALTATQDQWKVDEEHSDDCPVCRQFGLS